MTPARRLLPVLLLAPALTALAACEKSIHGPSELACNQARRDVQSAVDNYRILEAKTPASEMNLYPKYQRMISELMDVHDGAVVPQPGGGCD